MEGERVMGDEIMREALARIAYEDPEEPWRIAHAALKATAEPLGAARADALLTDAAPDLLAFAEAFRDCMARDGFHGDAPDELFAHAQALITKARGGQQ